MRRLSLRNLLILNAGLCTAVLAALALQAAPTLMNSAQAQVSDTLAQGYEPEEVTTGEVTPGIVSSQSQRRQMIAELQKLTQKLDAISQKLDAGITVKGLPRAEAKEKDAVLLPPPASRR